MKLSDFKLGMKVVKIGGDAKGSVAVVSEIEPGCATVIIVKSVDQWYRCSEEFFIQNNPENWEPVVTQFRNK